MASHMFKSAPVKYVYLTAGLVFLTTCWFSIGFKHGDEHFQIIEFAGHILGWNTDQDMAWEFHHRMRPTMQPFLTAITIQTLDSLGITDPFTQAFLLRLLGSCLLFFALFYFLRKERQAHHASSIFFLYFFCLTPYIAARYSSEGLSASMLLMLVAQLRNTRNTFDYFIAGIFAGLAFIFRFQLAFAIVGTAIWYVFAKPFKWKEVLGYILGFLIPFGISIPTDRFFYGEWVLAPYEYFFQNIVLDKAANYGVSPWYYYFIEFVNSGLWLPGLLALLFCVWYMVKKPKDVITWVILLFMVGHMMVGHKEMRFLYPIACLLPFVLLDRINNIPRLPYQKTATWIFAVANLILIVPRIFLPADQEVSALRFLEKQYAPTAFTIYYDGGNNPYDDYGLPNHFYGRKKPIAIAQEDINKQPIQLPAVWLSFNSTMEGQKVGPYQLKRIHQSYPLFVTDYFNINNWAKRTSILTVYELE